MEVDMFYYLTFDTSCYIITQTILTTKQGNLHSFGHDKPSVFTVTRDSDGNKSLVYKYHFESKHLKTFILGQDNYSHGILEKGTKFKRFDTIPALKYNTGSTLYIESVDGTPLTSVGFIFGDTVFFDKIIGKYTDRDEIYYVTDAGELPCDTEQFVCLDYFI